MTLLMLIVMQDDETKDFASSKKLAFGHDDIIGFDVIIRRKISQLRPFVIWYPRCPRPCFRQVKVQGFQIIFMRLFQELWQTRSLQPVALMAKGY